MKKALFTITLILIGLLAQAQTVKHYTKCREMDFATKEWQEPLEGLWTVILDVNDGKEIHMIGKNDPIKFYRVTAFEEGKNDFDEEWVAAEYVTSTGQRFFILYFYASSTLRVQWLTGENAGNLMDFGTD